MTTVNSTVTKSEPQKLYTYLRRVQEYEDRNKSINDMIKRLQTKIMILESFVSSCKIDIQWYIERREYDEVQRKYNDIVKYENDTTDCRVKLIEYEKEIIDNENMIKKCEAAAFYLSKKVY